MLLVFDKVFDTMDEDHKRKLIQNMISEVQLHPKETWEEGKKPVKKVFLGDTDSYTVVQNGYTEDELIIKIKMATLLYDVVFIPAAYMWQSEQMKDVMYKIQPLILTENVLPIIRKNKETRDIKDYFEKRQSK